MHRGIREARNFLCPLTDAACSHPDCTILRCRKEMRERETDLRQKACRAWEDWNEEQEAARRALHEIAVEQSAARGKQVGVPPGKEARFIEDILQLDRHTERVRRHRDAIRCERLEKRLFPRRH